MKIVEPGYIMLANYGSANMTLIELAARVCYKSEGMIRSGSDVELIEKLVRNGHWAMIEHSLLSVLFTVDRGVSHELVRHRIPSPAQESTRYCNYSNDRFGSELTFINPFFFDEGSTNRLLWLQSCHHAETTYLRMLREGATPQEARSILPNSLKTEIVITTNLREWHHILTLRTDVAAHPQMRQVMIPLLRELQEMYPIIFNDIKVVGEDATRNSTRTTE